MCSFAREEDLNAIVNEDDVPRAHPLLPSLGNDDRRQIDSFLANLPPKK
ncbi:MAG: hypothetical protein V4465_02735 [Patescibacteria group bacterium]